MSDIERFTSKYVIDTSGCWNWQARRDKHGYGGFQFRGRWGKAHRAAYELFVGPIPERLTIDHVCENKSCVNPDPKHLVLATMKEQCARRVTGNEKKTHCRNGHVLSPDNLVIYELERGERRCRTCKNATMLRCSKKKV